MLVKIGSSMSAAATGSTTSFPPFILRHSTTVNMAHPITKIWLFSLKPGVSIDDATFRDTWRQTLRLIASYTGNAGKETQHLLLQNASDPAQLAFVSAYPSLELNRQADTEYAQRYMKAMFELVQHGDIMMLDRAIESLPMPGASADEIVLSLHDAEFSGKGTGGWDTMTPLGKSDAPPGKRWVHLQHASAAEAATDAHAQSTWRLKRVHGIWNW